MAPENVWVPLIRCRFFAEKAIRESGVSDCIFCPTWFMEVQPKYARSGRAFVFGKQLNPYHLLAADDYARMVAASYGSAAAVYKRFILHGPVGFHVSRYCFFSPMSTNCFLRGHPFYTSGGRHIFWMSNAGSW